MSSGINVVIILVPRRNVLMVPMPPFPFNTKNDLISRSKVNSRPESDNPNSRAILKHGRNLITVVSQIIIAPKGLY